MTMLTNTGGFSLVRLLVSWPEAIRRIFGPSYEIAAPHPARLLCQPVQPLEPGPLHPLRRPSQVAGEEQERGADTEADAAWPAPAA